MWWDLDHLRSILISTDHIKAKIESEDIQLNVYMSTFEMETNLEKKHTAPNLGRQKNISTPQQNSK